MIIRKADLCNEICRKLGLTRYHPQRTELDKREMLHVSSALDLALTKEPSKAIGKISQIREIVQQEKGLKKSLLRRIDAIVKG